jgi:hypothetical protein
MNTVSLILQCCGTSHTEESYCLTSIEKAMVIRQGNHHDWSNHDLAIYHHRPFLDCVHSCSHVACQSPNRKWVAFNSPNTAAWGRLMMGVPYRLPKTPPLELRRARISENQRKSVYTHIVNVPPAMSSIVSLPSLAFFPRAAISLSIPTKFMPSAFLTTGVTSPLGVATATLKST